ncbi:MAG: hypothetical protein ACKV0T_16355 [Planctomycetales bacterium]
MADVGLGHLILVGQSPYLNRFKKSHRRVQDRQNQWIFQFFSDPFDRLGIDTESQGLKKGFDVLKPSEHVVPYFRRDTIRKFMDQIRDVALVLRRERLPDHGRFLRINPRKDALNGRLGSQSLLDNVPLGFPRQTGCRWTTSPEQRDAYDQQNQSQSDGLHG